MNMLLGLLSTYHQHEISTFNTCSRGPTQWSFTDSDGGYNLAGADFPHLTPDVPNWQSSTFHPRAPPGLGLSIKQLQIELERELTLNLVSDSLHSTSTVIYILSIA
jgi:hypothetical protein